MALCADMVKEAWNDPAFLKEQKRVCGDDREYVFPYKRKGKTVKGHCRKLDAPRPRKKTRIKVEQPVRRAAPVRPVVGPPTRRPRSVAMNSGALREYTTVDLHSTAQSTPRYTPLHDTLHVE
eukprot:COSAG03_NODE_67_length_15062_cov_86.408781_3_plen_122_part_00